MTFVQVTVNTIITFLTFFLEALLHYNIGKSGRITFRYFPHFKELWKIAMVVGFFSLLSQVAANIVNDIFKTDD